MQQPGVNISLLKLELNKYLNRSSDEIFKKARPLIERKFNKSKEELLEEFDKHTVTQDLEGGPSGDSELVTTIGGGNLYSLLGFRSGQNPISNLRKILNSTIKLDFTGIRKTKIKNGIEIQVPVLLPTMDQLNQRVASINKLPWTSRGWIYLVENGIPWFAHYLFRQRGFKQSYSGKAIEVKGTISEGRDSTFSGIPYISELFNDFKKNIKRN